MVRHLYHINNNKGKDSSGDSNGSHSSNNSKENGHHRKAMEVLVILLAIHLKVLLVSNTSLDLLLHILISNRDRDRDREDNKDVDKCLHNKLNMVNSSKIHDLIQHNRHSSSNVVTVILNNRSNSIIHHMSILVGTIKIYRKNRYKYDVLFSIL